MTTARPSGLANHSWQEWRRTGSEGAAYDYLRESGAYSQLTRKLDKLLRQHRQRVFDDRTGDAHHRAIARLKRTMTFKALSWVRHYEAMLRAGKRLTRMGY